MWVVVHLDEMDDSDEVFGPFDTEDQAIEFGENNITSSHWMVIGFNS
jgi:hypothetical protein